MSHLGNRLSLTVVPAGRAILGCLNEPKQCLRMISTAQEKNDLLPAMQLMATIRRVHVPA